MKNYANGTHDEAELSHVNVTLDDLKNGQTGKLALAADIGVQTTNAALQAKLGGSFALALTADLKPASINGNTHLDVTQAEGALADVGRARLRAQRGGHTDGYQGSGAAVPEGQRAAGRTAREPDRLIMARTEGRLSIEISSIDKQLLNLAGAKSGIDFGSTTISSTNEIELAKAGSVISAKGQLDVSNFQLTRQNQTTPRLDLRADYNVTVDRAQSTALLRALTLTGTQNGNPLLKAELTSPMQIGWGGVSNVVGDSALTLAVTSLNLADWKPFLGEVAPAGIVNMTAKVLSQQGGQQMTLDFDSRIDNLTRYRRRAITSATCPSPSRRTPRRRTSINSTSPRTSWRSRGRTRR